MNQRRTAALNKANNILAIQKEDYNSTQNQRSNLPSSMNARLNSNKSGPIQNPNKISRKQKRDKASYEYFISIASKSLARGLKDCQTPYLSQPDSIKDACKNHYDDDQLFNQDDEGKDAELQNKMNKYKENIHEENIGSIVNHMDNIRSTYLHSEGKKRAVSQQKKDNVFKRSSKYSANYDERMSKYTSLREEKGLSVKPIDQYEERTSNRQNLHKQRNRLLMNNDQRIKNLYKMTPSKPIITSVLKKR